MHRKPGVIEVLSAVKVRPRAEGRGAVRHGADAVTGAPELHEAAIAARCCSQAR